VWNADGVRTNIFAGCFGIRGMGNVAGNRGQALPSRPLDFPYYVARTKQGKVHAAAAFAKVKKRFGKPLVCVSSIGPGATNLRMVAAGQPLLIRFLIS